MADSPSLDDQSSPSAAQLAPTAAGPIGEQHDPERHAGAATGAGAAPETPAADADATASATADADATMVADATAVAGADATAVAGAEVTMVADAGTTAVAGASDATTVARAADTPTMVAPAAAPETVVTPGRGAGRTVAITPTEKRIIALPSGADIARWSGQTTVPPPPPQPAPVASAPATSTARAGRLRSPAPTSTDPYGRPTDARSRFLPLLAGIAAFVLLVVLIFGVWLIFRALGTGEAGSNETSLPPAPASSAATSVTSSPPSTEPSTEDTTTYIESPPQLVVPPVVGVSEEVASGVLRGLGLQVSVQRKESTTATAGTVLAADPAPGTPIEPGSAVTLTVAKAPASSSPSATSSSPRPSFSPSVRPDR